MKKLLAFALVMVLAFSLLAACSVSTGGDKDDGGSTPTGDNSTPTPGGNGGGGNDNTPAPGGNDNTPSDGNNGGGDNSTDPSISIAKTDYSPGEEIVVVLKNIPEEYNGGAYFSWFKKGAGHREYISYSYVKTWDSEIKFTAPNEKGDYEIRLFDKNDYNDEDVVMTIPFTVDGGSGMANAGNNNGGGETAPGNLKTQKEVEAILTNFDISLTFDAQGQDTYNFRQASSDKGTFFETKGKYNEIMYFDFTEKTGYELDADEKYGEAFPLEPVEMYKGFAPNMVNHLFIHNSYQDNMAKSGEEKVAGRDTTIYTVTLGGGEIKLWIDDEYGFTLKYEQTGSNAVKMEVTAFKVGGVTVDGMVNLDEYEID